MDAREMPPPQPGLRSVRILGEAVRARGARWSMAGQDGGQSIQLAKGSLFVFSDTLLALGGGASHGRLERESGIFLGNCAAISVAKSLPAAMESLRYFEDAQGFPRELLLPTMTERLQHVRFWPQHGVAVGDDVFLFYLGIRHHDQTSAWGFTEHGAGLAKLHVESGRCERMLRGGEWRFWPQAPFDCHIGVQVMREGETVYVYSSRLGFGEYEAFIARVSVHAIAEPDAYEFFAGEGRGWTRDMFSCVPLTECGAEFSVAHNEGLDCYVMTYAQRFTNDLMLRSARTPWGPWSEAMRVGRLPRQGHQDMVSMAFQHAQFARADGGSEIVLTYSQPHFLQNTMVSVTLR